MDLGLEIRGYPGMLRIHDRGSVGPTSVGPEILSGESFLARLKSGPLGNPHQSDSQATASRIASRTSFAELFEQQIILRLHLGASEGRRKPHHAGERGPGEAVLALFLEGDRGLIPGFKVLG